MKLVPSENLLPMFTFVRFSISGRGTQGWKAHTKAVYDYANLRLRLGKSLVCENRDGVLHILH